MTLQTNSAGKKLISRIRTPRHPIEEAEYVVANLVEISINDNLFSALVFFVMCFGAKTFARSTMLKLLNTGDVFAANDEFLTWAAKCHKSGKTRTRPRKDELKLFLRPLVVVNRGNHD